MTVTTAFIPPSIRDRPASSTGAINKVRIGFGRDDFRADPGSLIGAGDSTRQDEELVAAHAGDGVVLAQGSRQAL